MTAPLTDTEINERLAKGMGATANEACYYFYDEFDFCTVVAKDRWNPCEDLNIMHTVETRIIELGLWVKYIEELAMISKTMTPHATANERALTAVKVFEEVEK